MKNKRILIMSLLIIAIGIIGFTVAYFYHSIVTDSQFKVAKFGVTIDETFQSPNDWEPGDVTEKIVYASNSGNADIAVRIYLDEQWISADGSILANTQDGKSIAVVNLVHTKDWIKIGNYYYYKYRLKRNERTSDFMKSVTFNDEVDFSANCEFLNTYYAGNCSYTTGDYYGATYTLNITIETIQFDNYKDIWGSNINLLDNKPLTGVEKLVQKSNPSSVINYNDGVKQEMYVFNHQATVQTGALTDYRYIGNDPYNYVYFNCDTPVENQEYNYATSCEKWRILGVFSVDDGNGYLENRIKLVRGNSIKNDYWNTVASNVWKSSSLKEFLNVDFYNRSGDALTNGYGLKSSAQDMVDDAKYYLGSNYYVSNSHYGSTEDIYGWERGNTLCGSCGTDINKLSWTGKVGLMYLSDEYMVYGKGINNMCYTDPYLCNNVEMSQSGWIFNSNKISLLDSSSSDVLLLPANSNNTSYVFYIESNGLVHSNNVVNEDVRSIRPVLSLNSDVMIDSGTGQENDPYVLSY